MNTVEIKKQMMELWKDTFHDSDEYISLIFDNYFDEKLIEYEEKNGKIISALLGIPYEFSSKNCDISTGNITGNFKSSLRENCECCETISNPKSDNISRKGDESQLQESLGLSVPYSDINYEKSDGHNEINKIGTAGGDDNFKLKGLYLCGLATHPGYREGGIMSRLIEKINERARDLYFDFTFLIPANGGLIKYYYDRDYVVAFYRIINRYLLEHDFRNELLNDARVAINYAIRKNSTNDQSESVSINDESNVGQKNDCSCVIESAQYDSINENALIKEILQYYDSVKVEKLQNYDNNKVEKIKSFIRKFETSQDEMTLCHSPKDIDIILRDNLISEGDILIATNSDDNICGVAFVAGIVNNEIDVRQIMAVDESVRLKILSTISSKLHQKYPKANALRLYRRPSEAHRVALWRPVFGASDPSNPIVGAFGEFFSAYSEADFPEVYGMIRLLNCGNILKFMGSRQDSEIKSILKGDLQNGIVAKFETTGGFYRVIANENLHNEDLMTEKSSECYTNITLKELAEIIFRRPKSPKIVSEAFGIPDLPMNMSLMLD